MKLSATRGVYVWARYTMPVHWIPRGQAHVTQRDAILNDKGKDTPPSVSDEPQARD